MYLLANNFQCMRGRIHLPLTGRWTADIAADPSSSNDPFPTAGQPIALTISDGSLTLNGTVARVNNTYDTMLARVVGGAGGFPKAIAAKQYKNTTFSLILNDLLTAISETISPNISNDILSTFIPFWSRLAGPANFAFASLVQEVACNWRVLPDGTVWIGTETWPLCPMTDYDLLGWQPQERACTITSEAPNILPGMSFQNGNVTDVRFDIEPSLAHIKVWFADPNFPAASGLVPLDRLKRAFAEWSKASNPRIDYHALYECTVLSQNADGTLELQPNVQSIPGLSSVPIRHTNPGETFKVAANSTCLLGWSNGDPAKPYASAWKQVTANDLQSLSLIAALTTLGAPGATSDFVATANRVLSQLKAMATAFNNHTHVLTLSMGTGTAAAPIAQMSPSAPASSTVQVQG